MRATSARPRDELVLHRFLHRPADAGAGRATGVVVNPDPRLRRAAKRRGWPVQDWRAPVEVAARERLFGPLVHAGGPAPAGSGAGGGRRPRRRDHRVGHRRDPGGGGATSSPASALVVCGLGVVEAVFTRFDWRTRVRMKVADGDPVAPDDDRGHGARAGGGAAGRRADGAELPAAPVGHRDADPGVRGARPRAPSCASPTRARRRRAARAGEVRRAHRRRRATTAPIWRRGS